MPMTVKNPLNNEIVVGEVDFYLLTKNEKKIPDNHLNISVQNSLKAFFMGSDFNYANSNDFRKMFLENSIENEDLKA